MKIFLVLMVAVICFMVECSPERTIQVQVAMVEILKMEPYYRSERENGCMITWVDTKTKVQYISYTMPGDYCDGYLQGTKYRILLQR